MRFPISYVNFTDTSCKLHSCDGHNIQSCSKYNVHTYDKFQFSFIKGPKMVLRYDLMKAFLQGQKLLFYALAPTIRDVQLDILFFVFLGDLN